MPKPDIKIQGIDQQLVEAGFQRADLAFGEKLSVYSPVPQENLLSLDSVREYLAANGISNIVVSQVQEDSAFVFDYFGGCIFIDIISGEISLQVMPELMGVALTTAYGYALDPFSRKTKKFE